MSKAKRVIGNLLASLVVGILTGLVAYLLSLNITYLSLYTTEGLYFLTYFFTLIAVPLTALAAVTITFVILQSSSDTPWYKKSSAKLGITIWGAILVFALLTSYPRLAHNSKEARNDTLSPAFTELCIDMTPEGEMPEFVSAQVRGSYALEFESFNESNFELINSFVYFAKNMGPFDIDRFTTAERVSSRGWKTADGDDRPGGDLGDAKALVCQYNYLVEHEVVNYENRTKYPEVGEVDCSRFLVYMVVIDVEKDEVIAAKQFPYPDDWLSTVCPADGVRMVSLYPDRRPLIAATTGTVELVDDGAKEIGDWLNTVVLP